jgi:hypothetical protein
MRPPELQGGFMNNKSNMKRSDSLADKQKAFGRLFIVFVVAFPEPLTAFGLTSLTTVMLSRLS